MFSFALEWEEGYVVTRMKWIVRARVVRETSVRPLEMNAFLPGCVWNATPRSLSPLERNIGFWTQA